MPGGARFLYGSEIRAAGLPAARLRAVPERPINATSQSGTRRQAFLGEDSDKAGPHYAKDRPDPRTHKRQIASMVAMARLRAAPEPDPRLRPLRSSASAVVAPRLAARSAMALVRRP